MTGPFSLKLKIGGAMCVLLAGAIPAAFGFTMQSALPLYVYPSAGQPDWTAAIRAGPGRVNFIIANVNNGPGTGLQSDWDSMIEHSVSKGVAIYGYVYSKYGTRDGALVDADVSTWLRLYPKISGIFIDETASDASQVAYYQARYNYIKQLNPNLRVVINPGTPTDEGYMSACDVNTIFEAPYSTWLGSTVPAWVSKYTEDRFYAIVYGVPSPSEMEKVVSTAKARNFGNVFVTAALTPSDPLPADFLSELDVISAQCSPLPTVSSPPAPEPPPVILFFGVSRVTATSATIHWTTAAPSSGSVAVSATPSDSSVLSDSLLATSHVVHLRNLARDSVFYYQISAQAPDGSSSTVTPAAAFETKGRKLPRLVR